MPEYLIDSPENSRLDPYRELKSPAARGRETFVAEGEKLVLRLFDSPCRVDSILCTAAVRARLHHLFPADVPIYVAGTPIISNLIGFQFHRGVLACGRPPVEMGLSALCAKRSRHERSLLVLCPEIRDPTNLGTIIRTAAAFGAAGVVTGSAGTNPFSRRVLRTSMGTVFRLPIVQTDDWVAVLTTLHDADFESIATVLDPGAVPLADSERPARTALLLGNEDSGLPADLVARCRRRVTLPMAAGVDSLNVAVTAGIVLFHFANLPPGVDPA